MGQTGPAQSDEAYATVLLEDRETGDSRCLYSNADETIEKGTGVAYSEKTNTVTVNSYTEIIEDDWVTAGIAVWGTTTNKKNGLVTKYSGKMSVNTYELQVCQVL